MISEDRAMQVFAARLAAIVERITWRPDAVLTVEPIVDITWLAAKIRCVRQVLDSRRRGEIPITFTVPVPFHLADQTDEWIVQWVFEAVIVPMEVHEAQEWFRLDGELVNDPHAVKR